MKKLIISNGRIASCSHSELHHGKIVEFTARIKKKYRGYGRISVISFSAYGNLKKKTLLIRVRTIYIYIYGLIIEATNLKFF